MKRIWAVAAALWGVAEATVFFIVPDVLLTAAILGRDWRSALKLAVIAAAGATCAGVGMYAWGALDGDGARRVMLMIPAIGPDLFRRTGDEMQGLWPVHMLVGAVTGVPYKLYAIAAGEHGISPFPFIVASFVARLTRFSFAIGLVAVLDACFDRMGWQRVKASLLGVGWVVLYVVYFSYRAAA